MRSQRRSKFAAPLVVIAGCGGAVVPPPPPPLRPEPVEAPPIAEQCFSGDIVCEGPKCAPIPNLGGVIAPVSSVHVDTNGLGIVVKTPSYVFVTVRWKGAFVDDNDQPIASTQFTIDTADGNVFATKVNASCELPSKRVSVWPTDENGAPQYHKPFQCCTNPPRPPINRPSP